MENEEKLIAPNFSATQKNLILYFTFVILPPPMMIHKITSSVDYNLWSKRLNTLLNESTN